MPEYEKTIILKNRILKQKGHVVQYMGDGVNDAPSQPTADQVISVKSATDIDKHASDIKCPNMKKRLFLKIEYLINRERT